MKYRITILLFAFIVSITAMPKSLEAEEHDFSTGCQIVGQALGAVGTARVAIGAFRAMEIALDSVAAMTWIPGITAGGAGVAGWAFEEPCNAALNDYVDYWDSQTLPYDVYLNTFCRGNPMSCPDPLLNPSCGLYQVCNGHPFPPTNPWECGTFGHCLPWVLDLGKQAITLNDVLDAIGFTDYAVSSGTWSPNPPPGVIIMQ